MDHLKNVLKQGISVLIFPEGTQNRSSEILQPFYEGAFRIAVETQQSILPMVIINAGNLMPPGKLYVKPGKITVIIGKEISTQGLTLQDVSHIKEKVFTLMKNMISSHTDA